MVLFFISRSFEILLWLGQVRPSALCHLRPLKLPLATRLAFGVSIQIIQGNVLIGVGRALFGGGVITFRLRLLPNSAGRWGQTSMAQSWFLCC